MRFYSSLLTISATMQVAGAHTLDEEHSLAEQVGHQLLGSHHLPMTIMMIAATLGVFYLAYQRLTARKK